MSTRAMVPASGDGVCGVSVTTDRSNDQLTANTQPRRSRPGRPAVLTEAERRAALLDAAAAIFLGKGYAAATMHIIALKAGMSKKTVYQIFPSKVALFDALLIDRIFQIPAAPDCAGCDLAESLSRLLLTIADVLLLPDRVGLIRLIISDGVASPELQTAFERMNMARDLNAVESWLSEGQARGVLRKGDVAEDAKLLFGMTIAGPILQSLVNAPVHGNAPSVAHMIRTAVPIFLRGLAITRHDSIVTCDPP
jgi:TetR/AcrR family transcriptional regulator of autoinduction and epiphytic fitness